MHRYLGFWSNQDSALTDGVRWLSPAALAQVADAGGYPQSAESHILNLGPGEKIILAIVAKGGRGRDFKLCLCDPDLTSLRAAADLLREDDENARLKWFILNAD